MTAPFVIGYSPITLWDVRAAELLLLGNRRPIVGAERRSGQTGFVPQVAFGVVGPAVANSGGPDDLGAGDNDLIPLNRGFSIDEVAVLPRDGEPGQFAVLGFQPAFVMAKREDS